MAGPLAALGAATLGGEEAPVEVRGMATFRRGFNLERALIVPSVTTSGAVTAGSLIGGQARHPGLGRMPAAL